MSVEELLKPRYKVIADWPKAENIPVKVGDIFYESGIMKFFYIQGKESDGSAMKYELEKYPHLFKKLEWWEERKESDMPEYVKISEFPHKGEFTYIHVDGERAVHSFNVGGYFGIKYQKGGGTYIGAIGESNFLPATKEEYLNKPKKSTL